MVVTILGSGGALILELLDQRIGSVLYLSEALDLPVLGVIRKPRVSSRKKTTSGKSSGGEGAGNLSLPA